MGGGGSKSEDTGKGKGAKNAVAPAFEPKIKPSMLSVDETGTSFITLTWSYKIPSVNTFMIESKKLGDAAWKAPVTVKGPAGKSRTYKYANLQAGCSYMFRIKAVSGKAESLFSAISPPFSTDRVPKVAPKAAAPAGGKAATKQTGAKKTPSAPAKKAPAAPPAKKAAPPTSVTPEPQKLVPIAVDPSLGGRAAPVAIQIETPLTWSNVDNMKDTQITLDPSSAEFQSIASMVESSTVNHHSKFGGTWTKLQVKKVVRIQNYNLWKNYYLCREEIIKKYKGKVSKTPNVKYLKSRKIIMPQTDPRSNEYLMFHGTNAEVTDIILKNGFEERLASLDHNMFGAGVYLAENSSKSNLYIPCPKCKMGAVWTGEACKCNDPGDFKIIVCRASLGEPHICVVWDKDKYKTLRMPPVRKSKGAKMEWYDSVLGESKAFNKDAHLAFREFIVYSRDQVYPEYCVTYRRVQA